jgi:tetratricopeptide (TPR) repeat protein
MANSDTARRYKAFLSYSHKDTAVGVRLFRRLDGYRPPKSLRGKETPIGPVPAKLYPCFRDREEEGTTPDMRAEVNRALAASDSLVVLCSPTSVKSDWVGYEIETFAKLGKRNRIHAVIVDGEPEEVFHLALKAVGLAAPLAADLRRKGDGFADGALKLIAGVLGLSFGELKDREVARARAQARLNAGIAAAFFLLLVGALGALWVALDRNDRLQSAFLAVIEQLTGHINQLGRDLEAGKVSSANVAREVEETKALIDLAFGLAPDSPRLLEQEARLLSYVYAPHYRTIGNLERAQEAADRANAIYARLGKLGGEDLDRLRERTVALQELGKVLRAQGKLPEALAAFRESMDIMQRLAKSHPENTDWQRDLNVGHSSVGSIMEAQGLLPEAFKAYSDARDVADRLARKDPDNTLWQRDLARSSLRVGDILLAQGNLSAADEAYAQARDISQQLAHADPGAVATQRELSAVYSRMGNLEVRRGNLTAARRAYSDSKGIAERLAMADPGNAQLQRDIWVQMWKLAEIPGGDTTWAEVLARMEEMNAKGTLPPSDAGDLETARRNAAAEATR